MRALRIAALVAVVGLGVASDVRGQQAPRPTDASLREAVDAVREADARFEVAWARLDSMNEARYRTGGTVSPAFGEVGPFRVVATSERLADAERGIARGWQRFGRYVTDPARHLGDATLTMTWRGDPALEGTSSRGGRRRIVVSRVLAGHVDPARAAEWHFSNVLGQLLGIGTMEPVEPSLAYRLVMLADYAAVRECVAGDATACWNAVGVGPERPGWKNWLRPEEFAGVVASMPGAWFGDSETEEREACLSSADPDVCERVLLRHDAQLEEQALVQVPLGSELVRDLTVYALEQGGAGAYERFVDSPGADLRERLGDAVAGDPDGLVLGWMERVLTRGSSRADRSRRGRSAGLLWYLVFAGFAARSSRWRLD